MGFGEMGQGQRALGGVRIHPGSPHMPGTSQKRSDQLGVVIHHSYSIPVPDQFTVPFYGPHDLDQRAQNRPLQALELCPYRRAGQLASARGLRDPETGRVGCLVRNESPARRVARTGEGDEGRI